MKGKSRILSLVLTAAFATNSLLANVVTAYGYTESLKDKSVTVQDITGLVDKDALNKLLESQLDMNKALNVDKWDPEKEVWVIVQLEDKSLVEIAKERRIAQDNLVQAYVATSEGQAQSEVILEKQDVIKEEMKTSGIEAEFKQFYTSLLNGFSAKVKYKDIETIENLPGVKNVIISEVYYKEDTVPGDSENPPAEGENPPAVDEPVPPVVDEGSANGEEPSAEENPSTEGQGSPEDETNPQQEGSAEVEGAEDNKAQVENSNKIQGLAVENFDTYANNKGAGTVVAIIDTGIDYNHSAFAKAPSVKDLNKAGVEAIIQDTYAYAFSAYYNNKNITADDVFVSDKIPFAFDYADVDTDVAPTVEGVENFSNDHGTHVAGITAGNDDTIQGVAPEAQLVVMKTFSDTNGSAYTNDILAALCDAYLLGVDVINLSLGSAGGFSNEEEGSLVANIYGEVAASGISIVCSAGNSFSSSYYSNSGDFSLTSNPDTGIISSPSSYKDNMSVASIDSTPGAFLTAGNSKLEYKDAAGYSLSESFGGQTLPYVMIPGVGAATDYEGLDVKDKVAVVQRGSIAFTEKANNAKAAGAKAIIIYNNRSGYLMNMSVDPEIIPAAAISLEAGVALNELTVKEVIIPKEVSKNVSMSDFSSWGPVPSLELKPEITAPGGDIYSSLPFQNYGYKSGTSMASPYMAGVTAIVKEYLKGLNPQMSDLDLSRLTNRVLMSTATPAKNQDGLYYSPRKQGAGVVDIENALRSSAYLYVYGSEKTKLELGDDKEESGVYNLSFRLKNLSLSSKEYTLETSVQTEGVTSDGKFIAQKPRELSGAKVEVVSVRNASVDGNVITVPGIKDASITVKVTLSEEDKAYMRSNFANGIYVEGFVRLISNSSEDADLSIPYLSFFGDWTKAPILDSDIYDNEAPSIVDSFPIGVYMLPSLYAFQMGTYCLNLPEGVEAPKSSMDKIAWAAGKSEFSMNEFALALGLLRGAKEVDYSLYDESTDKLYLSYSQGNLHKASYTGSSTSILPVLGGATIDFDFPSNSKLIYEVNAAVDYKDPVNNTKDSWKIPLYVDRESPVSENPWSLYEKDGRKYLKVNLTDNRYLMGATLISYTGDPANPFGDMLYDYFTPIYESTPQKATEIEFDVTDKMNMFKDGKIILVGYDYAFNETVLMAEVIPTIYATGVSLDKTEATLGVNDILQLQETVSPENTSNKAVEWSTSNSEVAKVSAGQVIGVKPGTADITVTTKDGGFTAVCKVTVTESTTAPVKPDSVTLQPLKSTIVKGETTTVAASFQPWNTTDRALSWTSSNEAVATVADGVVTAVGSGKVTITAQSSNGVKGTCDIVVIENAGLTVSNGTLISYIGTDSVIIIPEGVTTIGDNAFKNNKSITKVVIPESVTTIGSNVFYGCSNLKEVNIPSSVTKIGESLFYNCTGITSMVIPDSVTSLGKQAFYGCTNLVSVKLSNSLTVLEEKLFYSCSKLAAIEIPQSVVEMKSYVFNRCTALTEVTVPDSVTIMGMSTFDGCTALKKATMPKKLDALSSYTFSGCTALTEVRLWSGLSLLPYSTFYNCKSLTNILIPEGVTEIGGSAFYGCTGLTNVVIPEGITILNSQAFYGCTNLTSITMPNTLKTIYSSVFRGCTKLTSIEIPDSVEFIDNYALAYCTSLTSVKLPKNMNYIQNYLFYGNTAMKEFTIGENITTIGSNAFTGTGLEKITIPANVTTVDIRAFYNCSKLTEVTINSNATLKSGAFENCSSLTKVNFNGNITVLPESLFKGCTALTTFRIPDSVTTLSNYMFQNCTNLLEIVVGKDSKLTTDGYGFGKEMFTGATKFLKFTVEPGNTNFAGGDRILTSADGKTLYLAVVRDQYVMPDTIEVIAPYVFYYNADLKGITLSKNLREIGADAFYRATGLTSVVFNENLETIGKEAFYYCNKLTSISLPDSLRTIGDYAFYSNSLLTSLNLGNGVETIGLSSFNYTGITSLKLPDSLKSLSLSSFSSNSKLLSVEFGTGLTAIANGAFRSCSVLKSVNLPDNITVVGDDAFSYCYGLESVTFGANLESIGVQAFAKDSKLKTVNFNGSCKFIGLAAFTECTALESLSFPNNLQTIDKNAFFKNTGLKSVNFNEGLLSIGIYSFGSCTSLEAIVLPDSLQSLSEYSFALCSNVKKIDCGDGLTTIPERAFTGAKAAVEVILPQNLQSIAPYAFYDLNSVKELNLPSTLKSIGTYGLYSMYNVQKMIIPDSVTEIGSSAFGHMYSVSELKLPNNIKAIENYTFTDLNREYLNPAYSGTTPVKKVVIPKSVEYIGPSAFQNCYYLEEIEVEDGGNKLLSSKDGVIYTEGGKELFMYPKEKKSTSFVVPEGVTRISDNAFDGNVYLESVVLPSTLERIGYKAFFGCTNLKSVTFLSEKAPLLEVDIYAVEGIRYANFKDYSFYWDSNRKLVYTDYDMVMYYPENSDGYVDTMNYNVFFDNKIPMTTDDLLAVKELSATVDEFHGVSLSWTAAPWADGYEISKAKDMDSILKAQMRTVETDYTVNASGPKEFEVVGETSDTAFVDLDTVYGETYYYTVRGYKVEADGTKTYGQPSSQVTAYITPNSDEAAALTVVDLIAKLSSPLTPGDRAVVMAARSGYEQLTPAQKALVYNYEDLTAAEGAFMAADMVTDIISALPTNVTLEDEATIVAARQAYEGLSEVQKTLVENYDKLVAVEKALADAKAAAEKEAADKAAAKVVADLISGLPTEVKVEDEAVIVAARTAYEGLTEEQKALVDNYDKLVVAEKALAEAKAVAAISKVKELIAALPKKITIKDENAIEKAREAYEGLTKDQKALVDNYSILLKAEKTLEQLKKHTKPSSSSSFNNVSNWHVSS